MDQESVRKAVDAWASSARFRITGLGSGMDIDRLDDGAAFVSTVEAEFMTRTVKQRKAPYGGERISDGERQDPSTIQVTGHKFFENERFEFVVPGSEVVKNCGGCGGRGEVRCRRCGGDAQVSCPRCSLGTCSTCYGSGKTNCLSCGGRGYKYVTVTTSSGGTAQGEERCWSCASGKVTCNGCSGSGRCSNCGGKGKLPCTDCRNGYVQCVDCDGRGRHKWYELLVVDFKTVSAAAIASALDLPEKKVRGAVGKTLFDSVVTSAPARLPVPADIEKQVASAIEGLRAPSKESKRERLRINVQEIPVTRCLYKWNGSAPKKLWVYGVSKAVFAPQAPLDMKLVLLVGGGAALVVLVAVALVASFFGGK